MPLKSWAFQYDGQPIRAEIWWRFSGWTRKRLYINHRVVVRRRGWFGALDPMTAPLVEGGSKHIKVRFRPSLLGLNMTCEVSVDGERLPLLEHQVHVERKWQHSASRDGTTGHDYESRSVGCLILLIFILLACLSIPVILVALPAVMIQERMSRRRLRKRGRVLDWGEVKERCQSSACTLIYNVRGDFPRVWWTQDDVLARSPLPLPDEQEMIYSPYTDEKHPFVEWCHHHYLSEQNGKALLVRFAESERRLFRFTDTELDRERWVAEFPLLKIIVVATPSRARLKASAAFSGYLGDSLIGSIPSLAKGIQSGDPTVRKLCMEATALAGQAAEGSIPILADRLYNGPWKDRWLAAVTLTNLGPAGLDVVAEAAKCEDPSIQHPATSALALHNR